MSLKYPVLTVTLSVLGAVCVAGAGLSAWMVSDYHRLSKSIKKVDGDIARICASDVFPSQENLKDAKVNYDAAFTREKDLLKYLRGGRQFTPTVPDQPADLVSRIRGTVESLNSKLDNAKIRVLRTNAAQGRAGEFAFGFRRYYSKTDGSTPPLRQMADIAKGHDIVEFLVDRFIAARAEVGPHSPVILQHLYRDPVELAAETGAAARNYNTDEFRPSPTDPLRTLKIVKPYGFRIVFTGRTEFLRNYLNKVYAAGYPIFLRNIEVAPAKPEVLAPDAPAGGETSAPPAFSATPTDAPAPVAPPPPSTMSGFFDSSAGGGANTPSPVPDSAVAAPAAKAQPNVQPILESAPSEFTLFFEYIEPLDVVPASSNSKS